jgi:hypothetical protein
MNRAFSFFSLPRQSRGELMFDFNWGVFWAALVAIIVAKAIQVALRLFDWHI